MGSATLTNDTSSRKFYIKVSSVLVALYVLIVYLQNPPWPLWNFWFPPLFLCFILSMIILYSRIVKTKPINEFLLLYTSILILFFVIFQSIQDFRTSSIVSILIFYQLFFITEDEKVRIMDKITTILAVIIAISLPLWLVNQYLYELPFGYEMKYGDWKGKNQTLILDNYYFFIQAQFAFNRFYSIFDEPGTLGTLSAFILFSNKYSLKDKRLIIILAGAIFTFSFAFYILTLIGLILYFLRKPKLLIISGVSIFLLIIILFHLMKDNPIFNAQILSRFESFIPALESRTPGKMNSFFKDYIVSPDAILGKGTGFLEKNPDLHGNGYQFFLIENGIFGLLLVIGMYLFAHSRNKILKYSYLLLFLLSFIQRPFLFTPFQIIIYFTGISSLNILPERKSPFR